MSEGMNPYHRWLGIPAEEQPADHYRLLGLAKFEKDPEVIRDASERQMAHVRRYGLGQHAAISQRILNELGSARACLLDPAKKAAYDERLRAKLAKAGPADQAPASPEETSGPPPAVAGDSASRAETATPRVGRQRGPLARANASREPGARPSAPAAERPLAAEPREERLAGARLRKPAWLAVGAAVAGLIMCLCVAIWVIWLPPELRLEPVPDKTIVRGGEMRFPVQIAGAYWKDRVKFRLARPPAGATIDEQTGVFAWTPGTPGKNDITVTVVSRSGRPRKSETTFSVEVVQALGLEPVADKTVSLGGELRFAVRVTDSVSWQDKIRFGLAPGAPSEAAIDPRTGEFAWKPATPGTYKIAVAVASLGNDQQRGETRFSVQVMEPRAPKLADIPDQTVDQRQELRIPVRLRDAGTGGGNLEFSLGPGRPAGAAIEADTGVFTWEPQLAGTYHITVRVADVENRGNEKTFSVEVKHVQGPPRIEPISPQTVDAGQRAQIKVSATAPDTTAEKLRFALRDAPDWVTVDEASGVITLTPSQQVAAGGYHATVRVADNSPTPQCAETTLTVNVTAPSNVIILQTGESIPVDTLIQETEIVNDVKEKAKVILSASCDRPLAGPGAAWLFSGAPALYLQKHGTPSGTAVVFYPQKDPSTCFRNRRQQLPLPNAVTAAWNDVIVELYVEDDENGKWNGRVAAWDQAGAKRFFGKYAKGKKDGLCSLFKEGELTAAFEYSQDNLHAVHLISQRAIRKTFAGGGDAEADLGRKAAIDDLHEVEKLVQDAGKGFLAGVKVAYAKELGDKHKSENAGAMARSNAVRSANAAAIGQAQSDSNRAMGH